MSTFVIGSIVLASASFLAWYIFENNNILEKKINELTEEVRALKKNQYD